MTQPNSRHPREQDLLAEDLLAAAFALTLVLPSWDEDVVRREGSKPPPLFLGELADLTRELTRYADDLALVGQRLLVERRDGRLTCEDVEALLPVVAAYQDAADTHVVNMGVVLELMRGVHPGGRAA